MNILRDVVRDNQRVVNHHPHCKYKPDKGHDVQGNSKQIHHAHTYHKGGNHAHRNYKRQSHVAQKHGRHHKHKQQSQPQVLHEIVYSGLKQLRLIVKYSEIRFWELLLQRGYNFMRVFSECRHFNIRVFHDIHCNRFAAVVEYMTVPLIGNVFHICNVFQLERSVATRHIYIPYLFRRLQRRFHSDIINHSTVFQRGSAGINVVVPESVLNRLVVHAKLCGLTSIQFYYNAFRSNSRNIRPGNFGQLFKPWTYKIPHNTGYFRMIAVGIPCLAFGTHHKREHGNVRGVDFRHQRARTVLGKRVHRSVNLFVHLHIRQIHPRAIFKSHPYAAFPIR